MCNGRVVPTPETTHKLQHESEVLNALGAESVAL